jgi:hypothetical protein
MVDVLRSSVVIAFCLAAVLPVRANAAGLIPDRNNQVLIEGKFQDAAPSFLLIFSAEPLKDDRGRPLSSMTLDEIQSFKNRPACVAIKVYGKPLTKPGRMDVFFGTAADADRPWNDGRDFDWHDWEKHSADAWDNVCIVPSPTSAASAASRSPFAIINNVTIRRGSKLLYDSRARESYPNKRPISAGIKPFTAAGRDGKYPVLNLSEEMARFRRDYYEIGDNPILNLAYSDVAQTDKRKYANRGTNWCSEFATSCYRSAGYGTPDPNAGDVHWKNMREFFEKNGRVYSAREVAGWSDREKMERIAPGSFVSILIGDATHSLIFTTWLRERGQPITRYAAVSGNNKGMVWPHDPLALPQPDDWKGKSPAELEKYDAMVYFAVPAAAK